jgi:superfamily II DNA/RNA helicase
VFVLDEADRMLDMGFIHDIRRVVARLPKQRQTLFFSATMPREIEELASKMLRDPVRVAVTPEATTAEKIDQRVVHVDRAGKGSLLAEVLREEAIDRALVFTRTKHGADKVVRTLAKANISAAAIHGNKSQNQRERVLADFRAGKIRTLIATDIAARGIDVDGISHVINYDLPNEPESYVHRIGRTARAGATGIAISLCDREEVPYLRAIEKLIRLTIAAEGNAPRPQPAGDRAKHARRPDNRPHGHHAKHQHGAKGRPDAGGRSGQPNRDHHRPQRKPNARNGAPVYGERPSAPARQPHGRGDAAQHAQQGGAQQGGGQEGIAGVGFMRRPAPRRDDAGRSPR